MRAVVTTGHGGYERLEFRTDQPMPHVGPLDVLVEVAAAAVNATDLNTRTGWYSQGDSDTAWTGEAMRFPRIQGIDACGRIVAVGAQVDPERVGLRVIVEPAIRGPNDRDPDRVRYLGSEIDGAFADFVAVPSVHAHAIDCPLSDVELAAIPCSFGTAENLLVKSGVAHDERVLVTGASGGVGSSAVQLAVARGAEVVAVASMDKVDEVLALGATQVIGRNEDPCSVFGANAFDVVVDVVGGADWPRLLTALRPGGRYAVSGAIAGPNVALDLRTLYLKDLTLYGGTVVPSSVFRGLIARVERAEVRPVIAAVFPMHDIVAAQQLFESKRFVGKIALTPG